MQFTLRAMLWLMVAESLASVYLSWRGLGWGAFLELFLTSAIPASIALERFLLPAPPSGRSRRFVKSGFWLLPLFGLLPAAAAVTWSYLVSRGSVQDPWGGFPSLLGLGWLVPMLAEGSLQVAVVLCFVPTLLFMVANGYAFSDRWPRALPLRIPILLAVFTLLYVPYTWLDWSGAVAMQGWPATVGFLVANLVVIAVLWALCWRRRRSSTRAQALTVAALLFTWLFGLAFPMQGDLTLKAYFPFSPQYLVHIFDPGPAPPVDPNGWAQMCVGLTEAEVEKLLGGRGFVSGGGTVQTGSNPPVQMPTIWEYEWYGGMQILWYEPDPRSYVVWFDDQGRVIAFRAPLPQSTSAPGAPTP